MKLVPFWLGSALVGTVTLLASPVHAFQFGFTNITNNNQPNAALGESTLGLDVSAITSNQVAFTFTNANSNPLSPVITQLFFDGNPTLASYMSFSNFGSKTGTVNFQQVKNGVLPGGNGSLINFTTDYQANALNPRPFNGIGGNESLALVFNLANRVTFDDILTSLNTSALRVGVHVQAFANGGSESFISSASTPSHPVPEPITLIGSVMAIGYGAFLKQRRDRKHQKPETL